MSKRSRHQRLAPRIRATKRREVQVPSNNRRRARKAMMKMMVGRRRAASRQSPSQEAKRQRCKRLKTSMQTKTRKREKPKCSY
jgi:hypothetical protein